MFDDKGAEMSRSGILRQGLGNVGTGIFWTWCVEFLS